MNKWVCSILLTGLIGTGLVAQQNLTLEEAVIGQFRQFYPDQMAQLNWLPGTDNYVFVRNDSLVIGTTKGKELKSITRTELQALLSSEKELKQFPAITWINATQFYFIHDDHYVRLDMKNRRLLGRTAIPAESENPEFHPETGLLAYTRENHLFLNQEGRQVTIKENDPGIVSGQSIARNEYGISKGIFWNDQGSALAFYEKDERGVSDYPLTDYTSRPAGNQPVKYPMAGGPGEIPSVGVYHVQGAKTIYLDLFGAQKKSDAFYATNLTWSPDGKSVYVVWLNRSTTRLWLRQFDASTGKEIRTVLTEEDSVWLEPEQPIAFVPGRDLFVWCSWKEGFHNYYLYTLTGKLFGKTTVPFELDEIIRFDDNGKVLYVHGRGADPTERHIYSISIPDMEVTRLSVEPGTHSGLISRSGFVLDTWSSLRIPNRVDLSKNGKTLRTLLNAPDKLSAHRIGRTEIRSIPAADGTPLYARIIRPSDFDSLRSYPVVVYVYNGPHVQLVTNSWLGGASLWMNYLAEQGYIIFTIDGRGSAHRGKVFEQSIHRQLGVVEVDDQMAGLDWLRSHSWVDAKRVGIYGWSFGGFMTTSLMLRHPDQFRVGVAGGAVTDWRLYEVMYTERYMDTPEENPEGYDASDLSAHVDRLEGRLMLIHGTDDDVVVMQHAMKFIKAGISKGVQMDFFVYPGHAHNVRGKDRVHLMRKVIDYLMDHLKATS